MLPRYSAIALAAALLLGSDYSESSEATLTIQGSNCTYSQGYWKTHEENWPVTSLMLGSVSYTQAQLLSILGQPTQGNGLVSLARQLIATKLNIAHGADPTAIASVVTAADAQIGSLVVPPVGSGNIPPNQTSSNTQALDDYNNGITGPGHCDGTTSASPTTWGRIKSLYR